MASFMFLGFLTVQKPSYEDRVEQVVEGPRLKELWTNMEQRCFQKYLDEVNDDQRGIHVYQLLKHEVSQCKQIMQVDNRREVLQECTSKLVALSRRCQDTGRAPPRAPPDNQDR